MVSKHRSSWGNPSSMPPYQVYCLERNQTDACWPGTGHAHVDSRMFQWTLQGVRNPKQHIIVSSYFWRRVNAFLDQSCYFGEGMKWTWLALTKQCKPMGKTRPRYPPPMSTSRWKSFGWTSCVVSLVLCREYSWTQEASRHARTPDTTMFQANRCGLCLQRPSLV